MLEDHFIGEIEDQCGLKVLTDPHTLGLYATDASIYQLAPIGVIVPESQAQIPDILSVCHQQKIPVLPRGGGTSLAGQCINRAVVIDVSKNIHRLISFELSENQCQVEAGMTIDDLNDQIRADGLFFAPDPSTARQANIGGCIGNNAAGVHSVFYGRTSDNVLAIDACLADGRRVWFDHGAAARNPIAKAITIAVVDVIRRHEKHIRERFPKTMRRSSGYQLDVILEQLEGCGWDIDQLNLAPLLCGSEGTLAMTLGATLKLCPIPKHKGLAVIAFDSLDGAIKMVAPILELQPSGVELLDDLIMDLARENRQCARYVDLLPDANAKAVLFIEFFGDDSASIESAFASLADVVPDAPMARSTDPIEMEKLWKLRKAGEPLLHAIKGDRKPLGFVEDNAVPVEHLGEFVRRFRAIVEAENTIASYYAHASVGVLHVRPLLNLRDPHDERAMHRIAEKVATLAQELGGVPSGEHGDGRARGPFIESYFGPELLGAFREIKAIFDPKNLLNPGNIVEPGSLESISAHTRIKPDQHPIEPPNLETYYNFKPEQGIAHAVELCNGAGVCRRKQGGVMCPSYQATLDERHSTRGRGNALRLAITGQIDLTKSPSSHPEFNDQATKETLDLCLSCKGCKSECPSSVDIAKLKSEYLAQGYRAAGHIPLATRMMSGVHLLNRLGSIFPGLTNAINNWSPTRSVINHALRIHPQRSLPRFNAPIKRREVPRGTGPKVVILSDTFTTHNDLSAAHACVEVLEAFGYRVGIEPVSDLGRAAISLGNLEHAIKDATRVLDQIAHLIDDDEIDALLILEPSCLSAVCDDWLDLHIECAPGLIDRLSKKAALPEAFLDAMWDHHPVHPGFDEPSGRVVLHGHCHQKALWGDSSSGIFERLFPGRVDVLETGCCGMAGAFGYAEHRYELSMKIGEQTLFPSVRAIGDDDLVIAPGTSCRHQILDGTDRNTLHPIEALALLLKK
jgi:FAD/FMN-containing dehydrogenase/Fe-S oxidoreductase